MISTIIIWSVIIAYLTAGTIAFIVSDHKENKKRKKVLKNANKLLTK